jgi:hypothetical protein
MLQLYLNFKYKTTKALDVFSNPRDNADMSNEKGNFALSLWLGYNLTASKFKLIERIKWWAIRA